MPVLFINRKRWRSPQAAVKLIDYGLHERTDGIEFLGLRPSYERVWHLLTNIGFDNRKHLNPDAPGHSILALCRPQTAIREPGRTTGSAPT